MRKVSSFQASSNPVFRLPILLAKQVYDDRDFKRFAAARHILQDVAIFEAVIESLAHG